MFSPHTKAARETPGFGQFEMLVVGLNVVVIFVTKNHLDLAKSLRDKQEKHEDIRSHGVRDIAGWAILERWLLRTVMGVFVRFACVVMMADQLEAVLQSDRCRVPGVVILKCEKEFFVSIQTMH